MKAKHVDVPKGPVAASAEWVFSLLIKITYNYGPIKNGDYTPMAF